MFSGIIKHLGTVAHISSSGSNKTFTIKSSLAQELHIDQSVSHNGVCLTVETIGEDTYTVTAIHETLTKTNLDKLATGDLVNLELSITLNTLIDGHIVQGHVDAAARCLACQDQQGSWLYTFQYPGRFHDLIIEKGSVAVNGVSLTAFNCIDDTFSVAIIPYTYSNTNFHRLQPGHDVNIEFDLIGKYIQRAANR